MADETRAERLERELDQLIEELRAMLPGAEVLLAFLLTVPFTNRFGQVTPLQRNVYFAALLTDALAIFLIAPAAYHRVRFREHDKEQLVKTGTRQALAATVFIVLTLSAVVFVVTDVLFSAPAAAVVAGALAAFAFWLWWGLPLLRRARDQRAQG